MNKERRKELERATALIYEAKEIIDFIQEEEQEAFDNLPEGIQYSSKGDIIQECADALDEASSTLDDMFYQLEEL